ncbi:hypothetical protein ACIBEH_05120 [Nocardia salmonicida]|uniref:hypothetical protein n=1 Tax=Nocardia salmonicida TaxID=53431 RepID=UPI0037B33786
MIVSVLFGLLALGHLVLAWIGLSGIRAGDGRMLMLPTVLCVALAYDNAVIAVGSTVGVGRLLETLSWPRFALHAVLTPLLVLWARAAVDHADVPAARRTGVRVGAMVLTAALIAIGIWHGVLGLVLEPKWWAGTLRYGYTGGSVLGALPAIIAALVVLAAGLVLWRRRSYPVLAVAAATMTLVAGATPVVPVLGNAGELVLAAGLVSTGLWLRREFSDPATANPLPRSGR